MSLLIAAGTLAAIICAVVALRPLVMLHFKGATGGWTRLAGVYATTKPLPANAWKAQTLVVGRILYRNCVTVAASDVGLYLQLGFPLAFLQRPPLFIPWSEFKRLADGRLYWRKAALLSFGEPAAGTLTMPMDLFARIRPYMNPTLVEAH